MSNLDYLIQLENKITDSLYKIKPTRKEVEDYCISLGYKLPRKPRHIMGLEDTPGLRELILDVGTQEVDRAAGIGPRGGGKSRGVSLLEDFFWNRLDFDVINLGGSGEQAEVVYSYTGGYIKKRGQDKDLTSFSKKETKKPDVKSPITGLVIEEGSTIKVRTASEKQTRGPHPGSPDEMRPKGGLLVIDEEAEADEEIVKSSLPIVNTARPGVIVRVSTGHKATGSFVFLLDHYEAMGYKLYSWTSFDVCTRCPRECEFCIPEFVYDTYMDHSTGEVIADGRELDLNIKIEETDGRIVSRYELLHTAYCGGIAHASEGFIPIENIFKDWNPLYRDHFEVEHMGWRRSSYGQVIKNMKKLEAAFITEAQYRALIDKYKAIWRIIPGVISIDWGLKGECVVMVIKSIDGKKKFLVDYEFFTMVPDSTVYSLVKQWSKQYSIRQVNGDSSHPYCNLNLGKSPWNMAVREITFVSEKETGAGLINAFNEADKLLIPCFGKFMHLCDQLKGWKRNKHGKIEKKNDHGPDALLCAIMKWENESIFQVQAPPDSNKTPGEDMISRWTTVSGKKQGSNAIESVQRVNTEEDYGSKILNNSALGRFANWFSGK